MILTSLYRRSNTNCKYAKCKHQTATDCYFRFVLFCFVLLLFNGQPCNTFVNCIKHLLFVAITHKFYARVKVAIKCAIYTLIAHVRFEKITFECDLEMGRKMANSLFYSILLSVVGGKMWQL